MYATSIKSMSADLHGGIVTTIQQRFLLSLCLLHRRNDLNLVVFYTIFMFVSLLSCLVVEFVWYYDAHCWIIFYAIQYMFSSSDRHIYLLRLHTPLSSLGVNIPPRLLSFFLRPFIPPAQKFISNSCNRVDRYRLPTPSHPLSAA